MAQETQTATADKNEEIVSLQLVDIRNGTPVDLVRDQKTRITGLLNKIKAQFGLLSRLLFPPLYAVMDFLSRKWLKKTNNPFRAEIEEMSKIVGQKGLITQNMANEWSCCTTGAIKTPSNAAPQMVRVQDWIVPDMGKNIVIAHQSGAAGEFYNVTWPGISGMFTGVAKGRFAGALNQAPMRRHMFGGVVLDWFRARIRAFRSKALPPSHLLRQAFEKAATYQEAKDMLANTPLSTPAIFTLTGVNPGEGCVIERLENRAMIREMKDDRAFVTNHFQTNLNGVGEGWMPRGFDNHARAIYADTMPAADVEKDYDWFKGPIANKFSVLALTADAATGKFHVSGADHGKIVTRDFRIGYEETVAKPAAADITPPAV